MRRLSMKFYQLGMMVTFLCYGLQVDAFWSKLINNISTRINNTTDIIQHKEFSQANQIELNNHHGTIIINSWKQKSIAIEVITSCSENSHKNINVSMEQIKDTVKINTIITDDTIKSSVVFNILLPKNTNLKITTKQGDIIIKDVNSNLKLETLDGDIKLVNPHDSLEAKTENGNIIIRTDSIEDSKEFNLTSDKGDIEIYTTQAINTSLHASALQGKIMSDLPITLDSKTTTLNAEAWKSFKQTVHGIIGDPASILNMTVHNGSITIMPYMKQSDIF